MPDKTARGGGGGGSGVKKKLSHHCRLKCLLQIPIYFLFMKELVPLIDQGNGNVRSWSHIVHHQSGSH